MTEAIDVEYLNRQILFSIETFGPGVRTKGVLDHMVKEMVEVRDAAEAGEDELPEWVDLIILALDGAWRCGHGPSEIIAAIKAKQAINETRSWPDWRTMPADQAIEHDRSV